MNRSEVAQLFAYCCFYDARLEANEGRILAWHEALYPEIEFEWAKRFVATHYGASKYSIAPADFNQQSVQERKQAEAKIKGERYDLEMAKARRDAVTRERLNEIVANARKNLKREEDDHEKTV